MNYLNLSILALDLAQCSKKRILCFLRVYSINSLDLIFSYDQGTIHAYFVSWEGGLPSLVLNATFLHFMQ